MRGGCWKAVTGWQETQTQRALLEEKVKDGDAVAMWMLGVCCEFGMGTEQNVERAEQLYKCGAEHGNATSKLLTDELKNKNGRGSTQMDLGGEQESNKPKTKDLGISSGCGQFKIAVSREQRHWPRCC